VATQVAPGVWSAGTRFVNWYVVDGGADGLTVVDAGLPGYRRSLDRELAAIGRSRADVKAVVLTHGHIDHVGMSATLASDGVAVHLHPADERLAAQPRTNTTDRPLLPYLRWPATWAFLAHCLAQGALRPQPMPASTPLVDGAVAAVPGAPVVTHVPGHTDGSCLLEFRDHGVVFVGDLLCTVDPATGRRAEPQLQTRGSNKDSDQAMTSLERLAGVDASVVLPGHGRPWTDGVEAAVSSVRRLGCR
jgi:glyoxylase-like metal-dependent hydrolase (beta-lactamase superfamily II)